MNKSFLKLVYNDSKLDDILITSTSSLNYKLDLFGNNQHGLTNNQRDLANTDEADRVWCEHLSLSPPPLPSHHAVANVSAPTVSALRRGENKMYVFDLRPPLPKTVLSLPSL